MCYVIVDNVRYDLGYCNGEQALYRMMVVLTVEQLAQFRGKIVPLQWEK